MESLTSPLGRRVQKLAELFLVTFYFLLVLLPLTISLIRFGVDVDFESLSPLFFLLLLKASIFAFLQASLSVLLIATAIFLLASVQLFFSPSQFSKRVLELVGILSFSMSPTLVALSLIMSFGLSFHALPSGLSAIVLCHFLLNFAFFASLFIRRMNRFLVTNEDLLLLVKSFGSFKFDIVRTIMWPVFKVDIETWAPQVFLWCFMSFAPVVLLASGPQQNTPELLLYYSLLNDPSGSRMLAIFLLTATLSFLLNRKFLKFSQRNSYGLHEESEAEVRTETPSQWSSVGSLVICLLLALPFLYSLLSPVFLSQSLRAGANVEIMNTLLPTFYVFAAAFLMTLAMTVLSSLCAKELKLISYCNFISAPMILVGSFSLLSTVHGVISYFLIGVGSFLAVFPWLHRQVRSHVERLPEDLNLLSMSLGMRGRTYFKYYLWPQLRPSIFKLCALVSLWSLGEYTFSKALLDRNSTLALFVEEKLRRYQFSEAGFALSLSLLMSFIVVSPLLWKSAMKGRTRVAV